MTSDVRGYETAATDGQVGSHADAHGLRVDQLVRGNYQFVWRSLRRLGVREESVDDAAQQVFLVAARKIDRIESGSEMAFLFGTAMRVASDFRRVSNRIVARELSDDGVLEGLPDHAADPEECCEARRRRRLLDQALDALPDELRPAFVLFELEGMSSPEIADLLGIPVGTVASRLRRARELFQAQASRIRARHQHEGGTR